MKTRINTAGAAGLWMLVLAVVSLTVTLPARAQTEEDAIRFSERSPATGARMLGMGGAGIGGVGDWTALYYNPAALGYLRTSQLAGSLSFLNGTSDATYSLPGDVGETEDAAISRTGLSNLGYVYRVPTVVGSLVFAFGVNQTRTFNRQLNFTGRNGQNSITDYFMPLPSEFEITQLKGPDDVFDTDDDIFEVDLFRDLSFYAYETFAIDFDRNLWYAGDEVPFLPAVTYGTVEQHGEVFEEGGMSELSLGGAVEASRGVMVGASANFTFGSYRFERTFEEDDLFNDNDGVSNNTTDFDFLRLTETLRSDIFGVGIRGGISAVVTPQVRVGLTLESPTWMKVEETFSTLLETTFDNGDSFDYLEEFPDAGGYHIITPWRFGAGATFTVAGLLVSADAEVINWAEMRFDAGDTGNTSYFDGLNRIIRSEFEPTINLRIGGEFNLGPVALRLGGGQQPYPYDLDDGVDRTRTFTSAGLGFNAADQMEINFGWMREQFNDRYLPYAEVANAPVVSEKVARDRVLVGIKFLF